MTFGIQLPSNMAQITEEILSVLGREMTFYTYTVSGCSSCTYDEILEETTDVDCPVCSGVYWIKVYSPVTVSGHIMQKPNDILSWQTTGKYFEGDLQARISYSGDGTIAMLDATDYVEADGNLWEIKRRELRGVRNLANENAPNRVMLYLIEYEKGT